MCYISVNYNFKRNTFIIENVHEHSIDGYKLGLPYPEYTWGNLTGYTIYIEKEGLEYAKHKILKKILETYSGTIRLIDNVRKHLAEN